MKILAEKYYQSRFPKGKTILNYPILSNMSKTEKENNLKIVGNYNSIYTGNVSIDRGAFIFPELVKNIPNIHIYIVGKCSPEISEQILSKRTYKNF